MEKTIPVAGGTSASEKTVPLTSSAQQAWQVNVVTPAPKAMPSERLKARAELVRNALSSGTY